MPRVELTSRLSRHVPGAEPADVAGTTVRKMLDAHWTSDDGGDSWTCLSAHLPQVYAVRFA